MEALRIICIIAAIMFAIGALLVGKSASRMTGVYISKIMGVAAVILVIWAIFLPTTGAVDFKYCVLSGLALVVISLMLIFKVLPYILGVGIIYFLIRFILWVLENAAIEGGLVGTGIILLILGGATLWIIGMIHRARK
ncbi:MAG: hypothetical protein E7012_03320 [Alphaproteobacteria bacterium]|nr:hypothetical protein [Alphaproteobacteria bacterium]